MLKSIGLPNRFTDIYVADDILLGTSIEPYETTAGQMAFGDNGLLLQKASNVAAAGTLDLTVNTETLFGNPGGFVGVLSVSATRYNFNLQSTRTVYSVMAYGTTLVATSIGTQNGSAGGSSFSITMASNGVIRYTNTSAYEQVVRISFCGTKSAA